MTIDQVSQNLQRFVDELTPRTMKQLVRMTYRKVGYYLKDEAAKVVREDFPSARGFDKNIRSDVTRDFDKVYAKTGNNGKAYMHRNRYGKLKPALFWLVYGVSDRERIVRHSKKVNTGSISGRDTFEKAENRALPGVATMLEDAYEKALMKLAQKQGLI